MQSRFSEDISRGQTFQILQQGLPRPSWPGPCMNLTVAEGASHRPSPNAEGPPRQGSKSETTLTGTKSPPSFLKRGETKEGGLGQSGQCLWIRISGLAPLSSAPTGV